VTVSASEWSVVRHDWLLEQFGTMIGRCLDTGAPALAVFDLLRPVPKAGRPASIGLMLAF
jgi:hypothetical protein